MLPISALVEDGSIVLSELVVISEPEVPADGSTYGGHQDQI